MLSLEFKLDATAPSVVSEEQLLPMINASAVAGELSETIRKVVFPEEEVKGTVMSIPPGRELLLASPYCIPHK